MQKLIPALTSYPKVLCLIAGFLISFTSVSALTISPARIELSGDPGTTINADFTVINEQAYEQTFFTTVENFDAQGETGTPSFTTSDEGLASWVRIGDQVSLKKDEKRKISFNIVVPKDADAGGHFAAIFLSSTPPSTKGNQVSVGAKVGVLVLFKVSGDIKEGGGLLSFDTKDGARFLSSLPIDFVYRLNNSGNDRIKPKGEITIRDTIGWKTEGLNANPQDGNVLPNSTRRFTVTWGNGDGLAPSASFFDSVSYQWRNFALGLYFANLDLIFGSSGSVSKTIVLFILPWQLTVVLIIVLTILFFVLRNLVRRYNKFIIAQVRAGKME